MNPSTVIAGKYRLDELLGEGGMGLVHAAHHLELNTRVAIKTLQPKLAEDPKARARFLREARLAASIKGDHSTRIHDVGSDETGAPYMVMEYLDGESVDQRLERQGALPVHDVATIMMQLLDVLAEAHARGLVHRDLKPANLFLVQRMGEAVWVKVMDFGISKLTVAEDLDNRDQKSHSLTEPRTLLGSPEYMSPEQLRDSTNVDARADIWACGVVMFELLTAKMPFEGQSLADLYAQIISSAPRDLRSLSPAVLPEPLVTLVEACLRKEAAERPASAYEIASVLAPLASDSAKALLPRILAWTQDETRRASLVPPPAEPMHGPDAGDRTPEARPKEPSARSQPWQSMAGVTLVAAAAIAAYVATQPAPKTTNRVAVEAPVPALERVTIAPERTRPSGSIPIPLNSVATASTIPSAPAKGAPPSKSKKAPEGRIQGIDGIELLK